MHPTNLILGIESSCDETAAAIVAEGRTTLSSVVASQFGTHAPYGGVVPELASREHLRNIVPVVRQALARANLSFTDLAAVAVTEGPGLAGALLVGVTYAKTLAWALGLPLVAVNHLEGHIHAVLLEHAATSPDTALPALALVVSGGHTHLYLATRENREIAPNSANESDEAGDIAAWQYRTVGRTVDDAAGEAFDKVAKLLGLPYPGGPWIDGLAGHGDPTAVPFRFAEVRPRPGRQRSAASPVAAPTQTMRHPERSEVPAFFAQPEKAGPSTSLRFAQDDAGLGCCDAALEGSPTLYTYSSRSQGPAVPLPVDPELLFSFSGIKTGVLRYAETHNLLPAAATRAAALTAMHAPTLADALALCDTQTLDLIASFQRAVVDNLVERTLTAAARFSAKTVLVSGGVAANRELRARFTRQAAAAGLPVLFPSPALATDNAAMIAAAAWPRLQRGLLATAGLSAAPRLRLG